jgi:hypothetical protein
MSSYGGGSGSYGGYSNYGMSSGYNSGYNGNSTQMSKPMRPEEMQNQPPPNFREDMWGSLNGAYAMLNILHAGVGIFHFGKVFVKMTLKMVGSSVKKIFQLIFKLTGLQFLQQLIHKMGNNSNWLSEFDPSSPSFENAWVPEAKKGKIYKLLTMLRIFALLGSLLSFFLGRRAHQRPNLPPIMPNETATVIEFDGVENATVVEFEGVKTLFDQVKLLEEEPFLEHPHDIVDVVPEEEKHMELNANDWTNSFIQSQPNPSSFAQKTEEIPLFKTESKLFKSRTLPVVVEEKCEQDTSPQKEKKEEVIETKQEKVDDESDNKKRSEDFWGPKEQILTKSFGFVDETKKKDKKEEEIFELPSMLKSVSATPKKATMPWLTKGVKKSASLGPATLEQATKEVVTEDENKQQTTVEEGYIAPFQNEESVN